MEESITMTERSTDSKEVETSAEDVKVEVAVSPTASTLNLRGLPSYWKIGHIKKVLAELGLGFEYIFKTNPNNNGYVRFKTPEEKLRAKPLIENYTHKRLRKGITCVEVEDLVSNKVSNDLDPSKEKMAKLRGKDPSKKREPKPVVVPVQKELPKVEEVVTPYASLKYKAQLGNKFHDTSRLIKKFVHKLREEKRSAGFLKWIPEEFNDTCRFAGIVASPLTTGYRNKDVLTIGYNRDNELSVGFQVGRFCDGKFVVETCQHCTNVSEVTKLVATATRKMVESIMPTNNNFRVYFKKDHSGVFRKVVVRTSFHHKQYIVVFQIQTTSLSETEIQVLDEQFLSAMQEVAEKIKNFHRYELIGVARQNQNGQSDSGSPDDPMIPLFGTTYLTERQCGLDFRVSFYSFFQVNSPAAERMLEFIATFIETQPPSIIFDVCCGTGTIGLCMAKKVYRKVTKVIGLEIVEDAVKDAQHNAQLNDISNAAFIVGPVEKTLPELLESMRKTNSKENKIIILDPPRAGIHSRVLRKIREEYDIDTIIYISCNAKSCMADVLKLCVPISSRLQGLPFKPVYTVAFDLMPATEHVELVVILQRCTNADFDWTKLKQTPKISKNYVLQKKIRDGLAFQTQIENAKEDMKMDQFLFK